MVKERKNPEEEFRDAYAADPAGCLFRELAAVHARIDALSEVVMSANPVAAQLYELFARIDALEAALREKKSREKE